MNRMTLWAVILIGLSLFCYVATSDAGKMLVKKVAGAVGDVSFKSGVVTFKGDTVTW